MRTHRSEPLRNASQSAFRNAPVPSVRSLAPVLFAGLLLLLVLAPSCPARAAEGAGTADPGKTPATAGWLVDADTFARSGHGSLDCVACHAAVTEDEHPLPDDLFKEDTTAFNEATCLECHADVAEEREKGLHAGRPVPADRDMTRCVSCHDPHGVPGGDRALSAADLGDDTKTCLSCHGRAETVTAVKPALCASCHDIGAKPTHADTPCLSCHATAAAFPHDRQEKVNCLSCHVAHRESEIADPHNRVSCVACHSAGVTPVAAGDGTVGFRVTDSAKTHEFALPAGTASCVRCHTDNPGDQVLAAASVLPPKSVLCAACHAATLTVEDTPSRIGLTVFGVGFLGLIVLWLSTTGLFPRGGNGGKGSGSADGTTAEKAGEKTAHGHPEGHETPSAACRVRRTLADIFLQSGLLRESPKRWFVHALIFFPFLVRSVYGLLGSVGAWIDPTAAWPRLLLNKDWAPTAFINDVCGLLLLAGLALAWLQLRARERGRAATVANAPRGDHFVLIALFALTLTGFILEGARIALDILALGAAGTGSAFAGTLVAQLFLAMEPATVAGLYGRLWYLHALLTALVVASIPFTMLRHVITAPLWLVARAFTRR